MYVAEQFAITTTDALAERLGPLDVVVANAGIARSGTAAEAAGWA